MPSDLKTPSEVSTNTPQRVGEPPSAYHPFNQFPHELLAMVITLTSKGLRDDLQFTFPITTLQRVSHRWKDITDATPALWTTLWLDGNCPSAMLHSYLKKSGKMMLRLNIRHHSHLPVLIHYVKRWEQVTISMDDHYDLDEYIEETLYQATSLRHFLAMLPSNGSLGTRTTSIPLLNPDLESLHLINVSPDWSGTSFSFHNLTELDFWAGYNCEDVDIAGVLGTLQGSPQLKRLKLFDLPLPKDDMKLWLAKELQHPMVELYHLEELVLVEFRITEFLFITSQVHCPNLQILGIDISYNTWDNTPLSPELTTHSPTYMHLKQLDIWSAFIEEEDLRLAVQNITSASTLSILGDKSVGRLDFGTSLSHLASTVQVLRTHKIRIPLIHEYIRDHLPRVETIYAHRDDIEAAERSDDFLKHPDWFSGTANIIPWGGEAGELEDCLQTMDDDRIYSMLGRF